MDMQGQRVLHVTQAQAWDALNDPEILKSCIPGCDKFELTEANVYSVGVAIKIGPVSAKFSGKVSLSDIQAPNSYALNFEAQGGVAGFGKGESQVSLHPHAEGCELKYTVHSTVGGKLAQLGQRLIDGAAKSWPKISSNGLTNRCKPNTLALTHPAHRQLPKPHPPLVLFPHGFGWHCW
jgi:carbon monoxide dehydrogenase subunit G